MSAPPPLADPNMVGTPWPLLVVATVFILIGVVLLVRPRAFLDRYHALLGKMRGLPLVEWEMGHLKTRVAAIVTRVFGAFVILSGLSMIFFYVMAGQL